MFQTIANRFRAQIPNVDFCSLRIVREQVEVLANTRGVVQPPHAVDDLGAMVTVFHGGGMGYAATSDLSESGLHAAIERAKAWAEKSAGVAVFDFSTVKMPHPKGQYIAPVERPFHDITIGEKLELLTEQSAKLTIDKRIVHWEASMMYIGTESLYVTSGGGEVHQVLNHLGPSLQAVASDGQDTQIRTMASLRGFSQQGGLEVLERSGFHTAATRIAEEAIELLEAPQCPTGDLDLLLDADQMMLQIHESIGHPIELDRILGDERNYAGTSFVTPDMFGKYQYGSNLLNVTFDPTVTEQLASYGYDDDGSKATKEFLIKDGVLVRPLGGLISQQRSGLSGVANSRACNWNRPPIDRMANINLETGDDSMDVLVGQIEHGVYMKTNKSWSIDDSRNKFQFGCEWGREIVNGELGKVVKNPNYRGVSAAFWRNLKAVGDGSTRSVLGTPYCGKGEPNQVIRVGHASPACLFESIAVFGGAA
jgi:predicted Zn-dependent protease